MTESLGTIDKFLFYKMYNDSRYIWRYIRRIRIINSYLTWQRDKPLSKKILLPIHYRYDYGIRQAIPIPAHKVSIASQRSLRGQIKGFRNQADGEAGFEIRKAQSIMKISAADD